MGTKIKFQPTKTKLKYDTKAGDKMNIDLQGYIKHKDVLSGKPFKGSRPIKKFRVTLIKDTKARSW